MKLPNFSKVRTFKLVRMGRLELPHLTALEPKSSVSTNSTTSAEDETYINSIRINVNGVSLKLLIKSV